MEVVLILFILIIYYKELIYLRNFPHRSFRELKRFYIGDSHEKIRYLYYRALVEACEIANKNLKKYL